MFVDWGAFVPSFLDWWKQSETRAKFIKNMDGIAYQFISKNEKKLLI